jgi:hypothetical protein
MIIVINLDGSHNLGDDHNTVGSHHFNSDWHANDPHLHGMADWDAHTTPAHGLQPNTHALDPHQAWEEHGHSHSQPVEPDNFSLLEEHQKVTHSTSETTQSEHAMTFGATYTKNGGNTPAIIWKDSKMYRTNHDGSIEELCHVVRYDNKLLICPVSAISDYDAQTRQYCHIDSNGHVYSDLLGSHYIGRVQGGEIYNDNNHLIGYADSPAQGATHLYFLRA